MYSVTLRLLPFNLVFFAEQITKCENLNQLIKIGLDSRVDHEQTTIKIYLETVSVFISHMIMYHRLVSVDYWYGIRRAAIVDVFRTVFMF